MSHICIRRTKEMQNSKGEHLVPLPPVGWYSQFSYAYDRPVIRHKLIMTHYFVPGRNDHDPNPTRQDNQGMLSMCPARFLR